MQTHVLSPPGVCRFFADDDFLEEVRRFMKSLFRCHKAIVGHGVVAPMLSDRAIDLPLWLMWATSEYILATRDVAFLREKIPMLFSRTAGSIATVGELLERCHRHQMIDVGVGQHGIMRMLADDWNDGPMATWAATDVEECMEKSESVLNSAMASWVYDRYAQMLDYAGENATLAQKLRRSAREQKDATRAQWNGRWFRRAWLGPRLGWLGETTLWIEPQPWAILSGATSDIQTRELVETMNQLLRQGPLGAAQMSNGPDMRSANTSDVGTLELGAIWPSLNQTLVWALAGVDSVMALEEWKRNTLAHHAESYPNLWYGVWSGNDSYNTPLSKHPGAAADERFFRGTDFPVLNLHAHACSLYSASKLLGINFTANGLKLTLRLPLEAYSFESSLVGIRRVGRRFEGWYQPSQPGTWAIEMNLPDDLAAQVSRIRVNGESLSIQRDSNSTMQFQGSGGPNRPLRWVLE